MRSRTRCPSNVPVRSREFEACKHSVVANYGYSTWYKDRLVDLAIYAVASQEPGEHVYMICDLIVHDFEVDVTVSWNGTAQPGTYDTTTLYVMRYWPHSNSLEGLRGLDVKKELWHVYDWILQSVREASKRFADWMGS